VSAVALAIASAGLAAGDAAPTAGGTSDRLAPGETPKKSVTLGEGKLWGAPWKIVAFRLKSGVVCEGLIRDDGFNICSSVPQIPDPILVPAGVTKAGPKPTTFAVIAVSEEVVRLEVRLSPGKRTLSLGVEALSEQESRRSGLPSGFRYALVAVPKVRVLKLIRAFAADGHLVGRVEGPVNA
jgi:hypothetical protein